MIIMEQIKIVVDFPSGLTYCFSVPVVPRVGEYVIDPKTQQELRVSKVIHRLADRFTLPTVRVILSTE